MRIHKEGIPSVLIMMFFLLLINVLVWISVPGYFTIKAGLIVLSLIPFGIVLYFFRVPARSFNPDDAYVLSGADGTVVAIEEILDERYFGDRRIQVSVFMSVTNVHMNFYPVSGIVIKTDYYRGRKLVARNPKASLMNEQMVTIIETESGASVLVRQIAGIMARRVVSYAREGEVVKQSGPLGFIKFGSRVDLLLPDDAEILVGLGETVKGGITRIARLVC